MKFIQRAVLASGVLLWLVGCATSLRTGAPPVTGSGGQAAYLADAKAATADPSAAYPSLAAFEKQLLHLRDEWDKKLQAPAKMLEFYDFSSPEMAALRKRGKVEGYDALLTKELTLELALAAAFDRNPGLKASHRKLAGTIEQYSQVTYLDTIMRQYSSFLRSMKLGVGPTIPMDALSKRFPFPGTLELKAAIVKHAVEESRARYEATLRDLVTDVRVAYADYGFLASALGITKETISYLRQLEDTTRSKLSTGTAQKAHVIQTQVQISQLENELITLARQRDTVRARINALVDRPPQGLLSEPQAPAMPAFPLAVKPLYKRALAQQPDVRAAEARAARMATMIELAEQAAYPDLAPGLSAMEDVSFPTGGSQKERPPFGTKPKVKPDPWFGSKEAYLREARQAERAARDRVTAARDRTLFRMKDAYNKLDTAKRLFDLYTNVQIAQAEQAYRDSSSGYAADRVEFLNVVDALRQYLRFQLDADRALRDYHQDFARLESALGGPVAPKEK